MTEITTIVFDFGNVIIGWDPRRVYRGMLPSDEAIDDFLAEVGFPEWNLEQDRGERSWAEAVEFLSERFPHRKDLIRAFNEQWEKSISGPIEGAVQIARRLRDAGYQMAGLTNWSTEKFIETKGRYDIFDIFEEIVVSGEEHLIKPDPEIFRVLLRRIKREAGQCIFIDDSLPNIATAKSLGFHTIHFQSPEQLENDLARYLPAARLRAESP